MKTVGEAMREARTSRGVSVKALAKKAGMSMWTIYSYERDTSYPSLMAVWTLADALKISIDEYVGRKPKRERKRN